MGGNTWPSLVHVPAVARERRDETGPARDWYAKARPAVAEGKTAAPHADSSRRRRDGGGAREVSGRPVLGPMRLPSGSWPCRLGHRPAHEVVLPPRRPDHA